MEINVQDIIPQRPPFQMIDQLVDLEAGKIFWKACRGKAGVWSR